MVMPTGTSIADIGEYDLARLGWLKLADDGALEVNDEAADQANPEQSLPFSAVLTDGGEYSESHSCNRICVDDTSCYSSQLGRSAAENVVARYKGRGRCKIDAVTVRTPKEGYNSPVGQAIIFASLGVPDLACIADFDTVGSQTDYQQQVDNWNQQAHSDPSVPKPVAFVCMGGRFQARVPAAISRSSRYVVIKLLRPQGEFDNIDVEYVGVHGWSGRRVAPCRQMMCC